MIRNHRILEKLSCFLLTSFRYKKVSLLLSASLELSRRSTEQSRYPCLKIRISFMDAPWITEYQVEFYLVWDEVWSKWNLKCQVKVARLEKGEMLPFQRLFMIKSSKMYFSKIQISFMDTPWITEYQVEPY